MKQILYIVLFYLACISLPFAGIKTTEDVVKPMPEACPTTQYLKGLGFSFVDYHCADGTYNVGQVSNYGTKEEWAFLIREVPATSESEAKLKALFALSTLAGDPKPQFDRSYGTWTCAYEVEDPYLAIAVLLPLAGFDH